VPETLQPTSLEQLEASRAGKLARAPSGNVYRLRQINLERFALAGGLPPLIAHIATEGQDAVNAMFEAMAKKETTPEEREANQEIVGFLDRLVLNSVKEPALTSDHLGRPGELDSDPALPPIDYEWLIAVAFRNVDVDADGRRLWGVEPFDRFRLFRELHRCPEDCEGCERVRDSISGDIA
jgi:hypothetical protein